MPETKKKKLQIFATRLTSCPLCRTKISTTIRTLSEDSFRIILKELRHAEKDSLDPIALLKIFVCDLCGFSPSVKPIFQCESGHLICKQCFERFRHCWTCAWTLARAKPAASGKALAEIRSLAVENLLSRITKPCRFLSLGCTTTITNFNQHELNCDHMLVDCVVTSCHTKQAMKNLLDHVLHQNDDNHLVSILLNFLFFVTDSRTK